MSGDHVEPLRAAILGALKAAAPLSALVGDRVYDYVAADAVRPFIRYGVSPAVNGELSGTDGSEVSVMLHVFTRGRGQAACDAIVKVVRDALDDAHLTLSRGTLIGLDFVTSQVFTDNSECHGVVEFLAITGEDSPTRIKLS